MKKTTQIKLSSDKTASARSMKPEQYPETINQDPQK